MGKKITIYRGSTGINNKIDPVRLRFDWKTGIQDLAKGVNIDIDETGRISRAKGHKRSLAKDDTHSLFSCGDYGLFVSGDALCVLESDFSWSAIRNVIQGARMDYVTAMGDTYYMNGYEKGIVRDRISYGWTGSSYVGPTTMKTFSDPPIGHLLDIYNGRMFIAQNEVVWYSEPWSYGWYDLARNYISFSDRITMLRAVRSGLFISTEKKIYFENGAQPKEFTEIVCADYPAIERTDVMVHGNRIGDGSINGLALMFCSEKGICLGGPNGSFTNITSRKVTFPSARYGAGLNRNGKYVCSLQP